jgi:hypothetical protein
VEGLDHREQPSRISYRFADVRLITPLKEWQQRHQSPDSVGCLNVWQDPFVTLRFPKLFNLRTDPFETADREGMDYDRWRMEHAFLMVPAQRYVGKFLATFKEFPQRQKVGSFSLDQVLESLKTAPKGSN